MLWFNEMALNGASKSKIFQYILCCGSTVTVWETVQALSEFQYILCCGSTKCFVSIDILGLNFNTSYVVVQPFVK